MQHRPLLVITVKYTQSVCFNQHVCVFGFAFLDTEPPFSHLSPDSDHAFTKDRDSRVACHGRYSITACRSSNSRYDQICDLRWLILNVLP